MADEHKNQRQTLPLTLEEARLQRDVCRVIHEAITHCNRHDKPVTIDKIDLRIQETNSVLLKNCEVPFARRQLRILIHACLRRAQKPQKGQTGSDGHATSQQAEFDFENIEQFRGMRRMYALRLKDGAEIWVDYWEDTNEEMRQELSRQQNRRLEDDTLGCRIIASTNDFFSHLVATYGDLPPAELYQEWLQQKKASPNGSMSQ